jgi:hypothetical protein
VRVLHEWPVPRSRTELRSFLGLANYFKRFVSNYSTVAAPLTDLTSEAVVYDWDNWSEPDMAAFTQLKHLLTQHPVLALPDLGGEFTVMSDASVGKRRWRRNWPTRCRPVGTLVLTCTAHATQQRQGTRALTHRGQRASTAATCRRQPCRTSTAAQRRRWAALITPR